MIAVFDIGNTTITIGFFKDNKIIHVIHLKTSLIKNTENFSLKFVKILKKYNISDVFIGSVVPEANNIILKIIKKFFKIIPNFITPKTKLNIKNKYKNKKEIGDDRIANAVAAAYYLKHQNVIVIDFGTAITFDVINSRAEYLGGVILPGINMCLRCLAQNTAKLPLIKIRHINKIIGDTTETSMISGITNGLSGAIRYILKEIKKELKIQKPKIVLTGGEVNLIKNKLDKNYIWDKYFTLKGLKIIYDLNLEEKTN